MIDDIRSTLPPGIKAVMDSAEAYWQRHMGLRSEEVCTLICQIENQATALERVRNIVDAQDSAETTPVLVAREIQALCTRLDVLEWLVEVQDMCWSLDAVEADADGFPDSAITELQATWHAARAAVEDAQ